MLILGTSFQRQHIQVFVPIYPFPFYIKTRKPYTLAVFHLTILYLRSYMTSEIQNYLISFIVCIVLLFLHTTSSQYYILLKDGWAANQ